MHKIYTGAYLWQTMNVQQYITTINNTSTHQKVLTSSPPRGSNSQPSDFSGTPRKSLTLYPIELGGPHLVSLKQTFRISYHSNRLLCQVDRQHCLSLRFSKLFQWADWWVYTKARAPQDLHSRALRSSGQRPSLCRCLFIGNVYSIDPRSPASHLETMSRW